MKKTSGAARGFTIIEVMIVLAVAGLIMLIVFQAIPTVLRNSRNSQRKHDASAVLEAVSHYELNHSGDFPNSTSDFLQYTNPAYYDRATTYDPASPPGPADAGVYVYSLSTAGHPASVGRVTNENIIVIYKYQKCDPDNFGASTGEGAGYYDTVALYALEAGSARTSAQCEQL